jgi:hypothetical protein
MTSFRKYKFTNKFYLLVAFDIESEDVKGAAPTIAQKQTINKPNLKSIERLSNISLNNIYSTSQ